MYTVTELDNVEMLVNENTGGFVAEIENDVITIERKYLDLYDFTHQCLILFEQFVEQKSIVVCSENWRSLDIRSDMKTLDNILSKIFDIALNYVSGRGSLTMEFLDLNDKGIGLVVKGNCEDGHVDDLLKFHSLLLTESSCNNNLGWNVHDTLMQKYHGVIEMRYNSEHEVGIFIKYPFYN